MQRYLVLVNQTLSPDGEVQREYAVVEAADIQEASRHGLVLLLIG